MYLCGANKMQHTQTFHNFNLQIMFQEKTIIQALANECSNYDWVKQAIINTINSELDRAGWKLWADSTESDLKQAMNWGFMWHLTPEGFDFWENIHKSLK
jgi:hypothetical protein